MLKVRLNGKKNSEKIVTEKQYNNIFKKFGYVVVSEQKNEHKNKMIAEQPKEAEVEKENDDFEKIPISDMNKDQLMEFSQKHNIDTSNAKTVAEARKIIQKALRESKM